MTYNDHGINVPPGATGQFRTHCPVCTPDRRKKNLKDLAVSVDKGTWFCHHCGFTGGLRDENHQPVKKYERPKVAPKTDLPEKVVAWFAGRGIGPQTLIDNKIGAGMSWMPQIDGEALTIQFPFFDGDQLINIKHRTGDKNFKMEKGAERVLFGLNDINEFSTIIVEGELDKLALWEAGLKNCVSVPDGAPTPNTTNYASKFSFLESAESRLNNCMTFVLAVDGDLPGERLKDELIRRLGPEKCRIVTWPEGCKDANDVLMSYGGQFLKGIIDAAKPAPISGVYTVDDFEQDILTQYEHGYERGHQTGWAAIDKHYTVRPGEWTVVTGIPGMGKSEFLDALAVNLAKLQGWRIGVCSMENLPISRHFAKLAEKFTNLPFQERLECQKMSKEELKKAISWANEHFFFLMPDEQDLTVDGVLKLAKILIFRHGITGLIIDPWNELDHAIEKGDSETRYISAALSKIRRFARQNKIHVWVVAHPTKLQKDGSGKYPVPTPYDISGSSHWRNKADNAIAVHRPNMADFKDRRVEVHVQKIRFKEVGKVGMVELQYDYITGRYAQ